MFFLDYCDQLEPLMIIVRSIINLIRWGVPILLVIFGSLDLAKAVIAGKEDEMKKYQGALIKRFIYAVAVFLVVTLVTVVMKIVSDAGTGADTESWYNCLYPTSTSGNSAED